MESLEEEHSVYDGDSDNDESCELEQKIMKQTNVVAELSSTLESMWSDYQNYCDSADI